MKISIIIPTYNCLTRTVNGELCIKKLIDSLCNQTFNREDFEVLFVDDCSTDSTIEVIRKYFVHNNYQIYKLPNNSGGASRPRNKGIELSRGEYLFFLDSDDYLDSSALKSMYEYAKENDSDYVVPKFVGVNRGAAKKIFEKSNVTNGDMIKDNILSTLSVFRLFRASIIKDHDLKFPEDFKQYEDFYFSLSFLAKKPKISILGDQVYYYWVMTDGENLSQTEIPVDKFFYYQDKILSTLDGDDYLSLMKARYFVRMMDLHLVKQLLNKDISGNINEDIENNYKFLKLKQLVEKYCTGEIMTLLPLKWRLLIEEIRDKGIEDVIFFNRAFHQYDQRKNYVVLFNDNIDSKIYSFKEKIKHSYNLVLKYGIAEFEIEKFEVKNQKLLLKGKLLSGRSSNLIYNLVFRERGSNRGVSFSSDSLDFNVDLRKMKGNQRSYWDLYIECTDGVVTRGCAIAAKKEKLEIRNKDNEIQGEFYKNWKKVYSLKMN